MSRDLRSALATMRSMSETMESPLTFLHDPDTGEVYAAMIDLTLATQLTDGVDDAQIGHLTGEEDEDPGA